MKKTQDPQTKDSSERKYDPRGEERVHTAMRLRRSVYEALADRAKLAGRTFSSELHRILEEALNMIRPGRDQ